MAPPRLTTLAALALVMSTIVVPVAVADDSLTCFGSAVNVEGTPDDDVIDLADGTHGPGPFVVATFEGDDRVDGSTGVDVVCLGAGSDIFNGNAGNDLASGDAGNDRLRGGPGADTLYGDIGNDYLFGGDGDDDLDGGDGDDLIEGHGGADFMVGGLGADEILGRSGSDDADGQAGNDIVRGGPGADSLDGGLGDDMLYGGPGNDTLDGDDSPSIVPLAQAGIDTIRGGAGYDQLYANWTFDDGDNTGSLNGGPDYDACALGATQKACERDHRNSTDLGEEWRPTVTEVFDRWGLSEEECGTINGAEHCVEGQVDFAIKVLMCESSGWPFSYNSSSGATGLFQNLRYYWAERVSNAIGLATADGIATTLVPGVDPRDPVANTEVAAYLVYTSRETLIGNTYSYGFSGYPDNWNDGSNPAGDIYDNFTFAHYHSGWQRGPNPWGHWTCGDSAGVDAWDLAWIHPNADPQP